MKNRSLIIVVICLMIPSMIYAYTCDEELKVLTDSDAKIRESSFHIGLDLQTKYVWRGMEMLVEGSSPVLFPSISYQKGGFYVYTMGGYAINGKYAEVDAGVSYSYAGFTLALSDYFYPKLDSAIDNYFQWRGDTGHWLEVSLTYYPNKIPIWAVVSTFCYGADRFITHTGDQKQAYSTYVELGAYYDFIDNNRVSLAIGATPFRSCYNAYKKGFSFCNIDVKYTYNAHFRNGWVLPLTVEYIYNPVFNKPYVNFITNFAF